MNTNGVSMLKKFVFALAFIMWWKVECQSFNFFFIQILSKKWHYTNIAIIYKWHFREYQTDWIMKAPIMKTYQRFMLTYFQLAPQENLISWRNLYTHINQSIKTIGPVLLESPSYCQNNSDPSVVSETWMLTADPIGHLQSSNPSCR